MRLAPYLQGIVSINLIHIAKWTFTIALFKRAGKLLKVGQFLFLYGPFKIGNKHTSKSNYFFDNSLKMQNYLWGIRNIEKVTEVAKKKWFLREDIVSMPANNFSVIYIKV